MILNNEKKYKVYMHTFPNNKKYIGITARDKISYRWREGKGYEEQPLMKRAINKYGWENIKHEIIEENLSWKDAAELEKQLIKKYQTTNSNFGYNLSIGGEKTGLGTKRTKEQIQKLVQIRRARGTYRVSEETKLKLSQTKKGKKWSEETRRRNKIHHLQKRGLPVTEENIKNPLPKIKYPKKQSEKTKKTQAFSMKGKHHSLETKLKLSQTKKGKPSTRLGSHLTEEQKQHLREVNLGKKHTNETKRKLSLKTKNLVWLHKEEIEKRIQKEELDVFLKDGWKKGRKLEVIEKARSKKIGRKFGFLGKKPSDATKEKISQTLRKYFANHKVSYAKKVGKFNFDNILVDKYESIKEASEKNNISKSAICICCKGKIKTAAGYVWRYID